VKFHGLIDNNAENEDHSRKYFFTVKVTNNAMLVCIFLKNEMLTSVFSYEIKFVLNNCMTNGIISILPSA
jgi:hypothetical protein